MMWLLPPKFSFFFFLSGSLHKTFAHSCSKINHLCVCVTLYVYSHTQVHTGQIPAKPRSGCLKSQIVLNPMYTVFFPMHAHL